MKPILFNTEMVRAILDGRKTTTRRVIKPQPISFVRASNGLLAGCKSDSLYPNYGGRLIKYPYEMGDILYVREKFALDGYEGGKKEYVYWADTDETALQWGKGKVKWAPVSDYNWHPSIHMPKEAARIFLHVTDVRAERLQDITENEVKKEGYPFSEITGDKLDDFAFLWNSTVNPAGRDKYGWNANPWVWVIEFERAVRSNV